MKVFSSLPSLSRAALLALLALTAQLASAATATTTYTEGDLFIGFRQPGVSSNTLVVNIGSYLKYVPDSLLPAAYTGWDGNPFQVQFGVIPGTSTAVYDLNADLTAVFDTGWADNPTDGSGVQWAVLGQNFNIAGDNGVGLTARSVFLTIARPDPLTLSVAPNINNAGFGPQFNSFAQGSIGNAYKGRQSTENSSTAYIGAVSDANNWGARIGAIGSTFQSGVNGEQAYAGAYSGPTNSVLDLWMDPNTGSTLAGGAATYLGSFYLDAQGQLYYQAIPEPGSVLLLAFGSGLLGMVRLRTRSALKA